jgi:hypothetical protein
MESLHELDVVVLTSELPDKKLRRGTLGTVLEVLDADTYLIEFADSQGVAYAFTTLKNSQLLKVWHEPAAA